MIGLLTTNDAWLCGLEPEPRAEIPGTNSVFVLGVAIMLVLVLFNYRTLRALLGFYVEELINVRRGRDNVFDDRPAGFSAVSFLLTALFIAEAGLLLICGPAALSQGLSGLLPPRVVAAGIGMAAIYYFGLLTAYSAVGYTFSSDDGRREWVRGFSASTSILAIALIFPTLIAVFYPFLSASMTIIAIFLFIAGKIAFIFKGFRIFYDNFFSLLYFILYLCTLEIIPIILVYNCAVFYLLRH